MPPGVSPGQVSHGPLSSVLTPGQNHLGQIFIYKAAVAEKSNKNVFQLPPKPSLLYDSAEKGFVLLV